MKFSTSNKNKLREFNRILPELKSEKGPDIQEIDPTQQELEFYRNLLDMQTLTVADLTAIFKSNDMGFDFVTEDTTLQLENLDTGKMEEVIDIKWNQEDKLKNTQKTSWIVCLAYNNGKTISLYKGQVNGIVIPQAGTGFGFDPYFLPDGSELSLAQLDAKGQKEKFSARFLALMSFKHDRPDYVIDISKLKKWEGKYQNQE